MEKNKDVVRAGALMRSGSGRNARNLSKPQSAQGMADEEALMQLGQLQQKFELAKQQPVRLRHRVMDSEYWCTLCFQTHEQLMAFLDALAIQSYENKYVDGQLMAQKLGIELPPADVRFRLFNYVDKDFQELVDD